MSPLSKRLLRATSGFGKLALNGSTQRSKFWQLAGSDFAPSDVYRITRQLFAPEYVRRLTHHEPHKSRLCLESTADVINQISLLELRGYMTNTLLRDTDAMSMAHSLEVRVPLVDVKVVQFTLSLPGKWKLGNGTNGVAKPLLADALADLLPRELLTRPKMGFTLPFEKWMQGRLREEIESVFADGARITNTGVVAGSGRDVWRKFLQQPRAIGWSRPWSLYVLARWCEINQVGP
jgi:asparagine synthase (glutamine-hydrolysing)